MSRGYRVIVEPLSTARTDVKASDELCIDVALLPILGDEPMRQLLLTELEKDGWTQTADGGRAKELRPGLTATISADGTSVSVTTTKKQQVEGHGRTQQEAEQAAAANAARAEGDVRREAATALAMGEADVRDALEAALQRVYVEALQQKARALGQVESMERTESQDGTVEITIKVRA